MGAMFAAFVPFAAMSIGTSYDMISVKLPARNPTVTPTLRVPVVPYETEQSNDVSATHSLISHVVLPVRAPAVYPSSPRPDTDSTSVLFELVGTLALVQLAPRSSTKGSSSVNDSAQTFGATYDTISVAVPPCKPAVIDTRSVPCTPPTTRQRTLESDAHPSVVSHAVPPVRAAPV